MSKIPTLKWAQRAEKVFVTWECLNVTEVNVTLSEGLLTVEGKEGDVAYKLENLPLSLEIEPEGSKWFVNDRCVSISLKKKTAEWWESLTEKAYKRYIKTDFAKWCEEEDREYIGDFGPADGMDGGMDFGGMGLGGMGGMGMGDAGMGSFGDSDDDEDEADMSDLNPTDLPPLESDAPPPLESAGKGDDGPPPLEPDVSKMKEVD